MRIKSNLLRAAIVCLPKNDLRTYICGIHLSQDYVEATNGQVAIRMNHGKKVKEPKIFKIIGKIPRSAEETDLKFTKDPIAVHYDEHGLRVGVSMIECIANHTFPSLDRVIPTAATDNLAPAFAIIYLELLAKMFGKYALGGARFQYFGRQSPAIVTFSARIRNHFGDPQFIIAPMRQHKGDYGDD